MTVKELLLLLDKAQTDGRLLHVDNGNIKPVSSVSIRIDDTGDVFVIMHSSRCGEIGAVAAAASHN
jgi:hypothetical protein